jgi:hypothetical protein
MAALGMCCLTTTVADTLSTTASGCPVFGSIRIGNTTNPLLWPARHRDRLFRENFRALWTGGLSVRELIVLDLGRATDAASE